MLSWVEGAEGKGYDEAELLSYKASELQKSERPKALAQSDCIEETCVRLEEILIPLILNLHEIDYRPELAVALLSSLDITKLPNACCKRAALLLEAGGAVQAARQLVARVAAYVREAYRRHQWTDYQAVSFLARFDPSLALRTLRDTRNKGIRTWSDETSTERLVAAATALSNLNRINQLVRFLGLPRKVLVRLV